MLTEKFWEKYFQDYDLLNNLIPYSELIEKITNVADPKEGELILDAGSGTGNLSVRLRETRAKVTSFDFSPQGTRLHQQKDPEAVIILGDLTKRLPFKDNSFDKIISNNTLYTISSEKQKMVLLEFYRILRPKGKIILSNIQDGFSPKKIYLEHLKKMRKKHGTLKTIIQVTRLLLPTIRIFYYNYLIRKENRNKNYAFLSAQKQESLLRSAGFQKISKPEYLYAKQAVLNTALK